MGYKFFVRDGTGVKQVAQLSDSFQWSGDERVVESIRDTLKRAGVDVRSPEGWKRVGVLFSGGYFWAALDNTQSPSSEKDVSIARRLGNIGRPDLARRFKQG